MSVKTCSVSCLIQHPGFQPAPLHLTLIFYPHLTDTVLALRYHLIWLLHHAGSDPIRLSSHQPSQAAPAAQSSHSFRRPAAQWTQCRGSWKEPKFLMHVLYSRYFFQTWCHLVYRTYLKDLPPSLVVQAWLGLVPALLSLGDLLCFNSLDIWKFWSWVEIWPQCDSEPFARWQALCNGRVLASVRMNQSSQTGHFHCIRSWHLSLCLLFSLLCCFFLHSRKLKDYLELIAGTQTLAVEVCPVAELQTLEADHWKAWTATEIIKWFSGFLHL